VGDPVDVEVRAGGKRAFDDVVLTAAAPWFLPHR
jgi:hypothetical protein